MSQELIQKVSVRGSNPLTDEIIAYDDFEGRQNFTGSGTGADWTVALTTGGNEMVDGLQGLKLQTRLTTPAIGDQVTAIRSMHLTPHKTYCLSSAFRFSPMANTRLVALLMDIYTGSHQCSFGVGYDPQVQMLEYQNQPGIWDTIIGGAIAVDGAAWGRLMFAVDISIFRIISVVCNGLVLPNLSQSVPYFVNTTAPHVDIGLFLATETANQCTAFFDHCLYSEHR